MAHPFKHAESSARRFGGKAEDYLAIHNWFDESKSFFTDFRHRALRHHAEGIFLAERIFGVTIVNNDGGRVPVRYVGEQHAPGFPSGVESAIKDAKVVFANVTLSVRAIGSD
jgi:hypothetical protein